MTRELPGFVTPDEFTKKIKEIIVIAATHNKTVTSVLLGAGMNKKRALHLAGRARRKGAQGRAQRDIYNDLCRAIDFYNRDPKKVEKKSPDYGERPAYSNEAACQLKKLIKSHPRQIGIPIDFAKRQIRNNRVPAKMLTTALNNVKQHGVKI